MSYLKETLLSNLGRTAEWLFYGALFIIPLWSLPATIFPIYLNKTYLSFFLAILIGLLYLGSVLNEGKLRFSKNISWFFLIGLLAFTALSSIFSVSRHVSFMGLGNEPSTLVSFILFALVLFLSSVIINSEEKAIRAFFALFASFVVVFLYQFFQTIFGISLFSWVGSEKTSNLLGSWNEVAIFSGLVMLLSIMAFDFSLKSKFRTFSGVVLVLAILLALVVNFQALWWILAAFLVVFLAYIYSQTLETRVLFRIPFFVLIAVIFFLSAQPVVENIINKIGIQYAEIRPSWTATTDVITQTLKHRPVLGSGPGTFIYDWMAYLPESIIKTPFWQVRFLSGVGFVPTLTAEIGILGLLALLGFIGLFLYYGLRALFWKEGDLSLSILASFFGAAFLWAVAVIYSVSILILFLAFVLTGIFIGLATSSGTLKNWEISLFERSGQGFVAALILIFLAVSGVAWFYILAQKYYGGVAYAKGLDAFSTSNYDRAERNVQNALKLDSQDRYYRTLSELGLARLQLLLTRRDLTPENMFLRFSNISGDAIQSAQKATELNPADPLNWMALARIYEAVAPLPVGGAADRAIEYYNEALKHFPSGPEPYLASARVRLAERKTAEAKDFLLKAVEAKEDYAAAQFLLAQIEAQSGNIDEAIRRSENAVRLSPNDIGALFQLGILYYQKKDFASSEFVLERSVTLNTNYSNARYFLGLIYARAGQREKAVEQFTKILELNPSSTEVRQIMQNLNEGKDPLDGISPPAPAPETRQEVPIQDTKNSGR